MLQASFAGVSKDFGGNPILSEINLEILDGERILKKVTCFREVSNV
ncbi:MAG TPA: hypothetical protein VHD63_13050 [Ktedonobacteraceae bacterium]|nr:hypothetical protein [Ktedonobacteraceae bacterium]